MKMVKELKRFKVWIDQTNEYYVNDEKDCRKLVNEDFPCVEDVNINIEEIEKK